MTKHQAEWEALAQAEDRKAQYASSRGLYAGVYTTKAATYRKVVEALKLEAEHGEPYCACHLMPMRVAVQMRHASRA